MRVRNLTLATAAALLVAASFASPLAAQDKTPIKLGLLNDQSGPNAELGGKWAVDAARMAVEDFGGEVLGRKIEVISADHGNKADIASSIARRWFDQDGVTAITDVILTGPGLAVQEIAREKNKIVLFSGAGTSDLTGKFCSPNGFQWTWDSYAFSAGAASAAVKDGAKKWFFITTDYAFGHALQRDATQKIVAGGGTVVGSVKHPLNSADFASYLATAQASGADAIGLANAASDMVTTVKQAAEFQIAPRQKLIALSAFLSDVYAMGPKVAQNLMVTEPFYWDLNDETRKWAQRFYDRNGRMPHSVMAGEYSAVTHYLKAVKAAGTTDTQAVAAQMRAMPVNDFMTKNARIREDGRVMRDFYLFRVKTPEESKGPWDLYTLVATIPADQAARPLSESECPLVKK